MKNKSRILIIALFLLIGLAKGVEAQWQQTNGPYGGNVLSSLILGTNIYVGTSSGIFLSIDNGITWACINNGMPVYRINTLVANGTSIYAGTDGGGIYFSSNYGASWNPINNGLTNLKVTSIVFKGTSVFAGTWYGGVFLSTNNCSSWAAVNNGLTCKYIFKLVVIDSNIFAATWGTSNWTGGVYTSSNNGTSWSSANTGYLNTLAIYSMVANGSNLFIGTNGDGVLLSTNNGVNWVSKGLQNMNIKSLTISGNNLYAGTDWGIYLSTNYGTSWIKIYSGLYTEIVNTVAINGTNIFAGTTCSGIKLSTNNGISWNTSNNGLTCASIDKLAINTTGIWAGSIGGGYGGGAFQTFDNGNTWNNIQLDTTTQSTYVTSILAKDSTIYIGTIKGIFKSLNNGQDWTNYKQPHYTVSSLVENGPHKLMATWWRGVYSWFNNDTLYTPLNSGLSDTTILSFLVKDSTLIAGTLHGMFRSANNGLSWTPITNGINNNKEVYSLASNGMNIFAGTISNTSSYIVSNGIYKSTDNGLTWVTTNTGLTNLNVYDILTNGSNIFAATDGGVFLSTNNGASWTAVNVGLTNLNIISFALKGNYLYAGTNGSGVWKRELSEFPLQYSISTTTFPVIAGSTIGNGIFTINQTCIAKAIPNTGYTFANWTENGNIVSIDSNYIFTITSNRNLIANFLPLDTITTIANPIIGGITIGGGIFTLSQSCTVKAIPNISYTFTNWTENGSIVSVDTNYTFNITSNRNLIANFIPKDTITTSANPLIGGITTGDGLFSNNQSCTVKAIPNSTFSFVNWTENGNIVSIDTNYTFIANSNRNLIANFSPNCSANFSIVPDTTILHHYFIVNNASGILPLHYQWSWGDGTFDTIAYPSHTYSTAGWYNICLTIIDSVGCTNTYCDSSFLQKTSNAIISVQVIPQGTLGINTNELTQLKVYPNPTSTTLTIETNSNTKQNLEIVNLLGQTMYTYNIYSKATVDVSAFPKGIYLIKLNTDKGTVVKKFVKE